MQTEAKSRGQEPRPRAEALPLSSLAIQAREREGDLWRRNVQRNAFSVLFRVDLFCSLV